MSWTCEAKSVVWSRVAFGAAFITLDPVSPQAESMAVGAGRILALGRRAEIEEVFSPIRRLDFGEGVRLPGLHGPALPFPQLRPHPPARLALRGEILGGDGRYPRRAPRSTARLRQRGLGREGSGRSGYRGEAGDQNRWEGRRFPTRELLDRVFPDEPVLAIRVDGHAAMANEKALAGRWHRRVDQGGRRHRRPLWRGPHGAPPRQCVSISLKRPFPSPTRRRCGGPSPRPRRNAWRSG